MRSIVAAVGATLVLSACGADVNSGTVSNKHYEAARTSYLSQCVAVGKNPCGSTILTPTYHPEHYVITLTANGESEEHYVDPQTYDDANIGDTLTLGD